MDQDPRQVGAQRLEDDTDKSAEQLRAEIEETREDLGDTVEALAAKTDVKARARAKADELKRTTVAKKDELITRAKQAPPIGGSNGDPDASANAPVGSTARPVPGPDGPSVLEQVKAAAAQNPVPTAALAAFVGGVAFGRIITRR